MHLRDVLPGRAGEEQPCNPPAVGKQGKVNIHAGSAIANQVLIVKNVYLIPRRVVAACR